MAILERFYPNIVSYFAKGLLHEEIIKKSCMVLPSKKCQGTSCVGFKFKRRRYNWRHLLIKRRGRCGYLG